MAQIRAVTLSPEGAVCVAVLYGKQVTVGYCKNLNHCNRSSDMSDIVCHTKSFNTILRSVQFSNGGRYLVVCGDDKKAIVLDPRELTVINERVLSKRPTSFTFTQDNGMLLVADKAGEVNRHRLPDMTMDGETGDSSSMMLGHSSIVLDMVLLSREEDSCETFIATCDRDEKIRVSHYPNGYNIHRYCLYHTSFVSCLCAIRRFPRLLLSGGGDGLICVWDWYNGQLLSSVDHHKGSKGTGDKNSDPVVVTGVSEFSKYGDCTDNGSDTTCLMAVTTSQYSGVLFYTLTNTGILSLAAHVAPLTLSPVPWSIDISRDTDGEEKLWVCVNNETKPIQCFKVNHDKIMQLESDSEPILSELNKLSIVEGASGCEVNWSDLQKHDYDNMTLYLAKKEERINLKTRGRCDVIDEDEYDDGTSSREPKAMKLDDNS